MDHWQYSLLAAIVASIALLALWLHRLRTSYLEPPVLFLLGWSVVLGFVLLGLVTYDRVLTGRSCVLLIASIAAFVVGAVTAMSLCERRPISCEAQPGPSALGRLADLTGPVLGVAGVAYLVLQSRDVAQFLASGGFAAMTLADIRVEFLGEAEVALSPLGVMKAVARAAALMLATAVPLLVRMRRPWLSVLGVAGALALLSESALAGGRMVLAYVALSMIYLHLHTARAVGEAVKLRLRRLAGLGALVMAMSYGLLVVFPAARNPALIEKTDFFLGMVHTAHVSDWVWRLSEKPALGSLPIFAFASTYLSQPVVKYTFFIEESDIEDWHLLGAYNFPVAAKLISLATSRTSSWVGIRAELAAISEQRGYSGNPWATGVRDLNIDFGLGGAILAMFLFGVASQWLYEKATTAAVPEWRVLAALAAPVPFFFAFFSPFPLGVFSNTIAIALVWAILAEVLHGRPRHTAGGASN